MIPGGTTIDVAMALMLPPARTPVVLAMVMLVVARDPDEPDAGRGHFFHGSRRRREVEVHLGTREGRRGKCGNRCSGNRDGEKLLHCLPPWSRESSVPSRYDPPRPSEAGRRRVPLSA